MKALFCFTATFIKHWDHFSCFLAPENKKQIFSERIRAQKSWAILFKLQKKCNKVTPQLSIQVSKVRFKYEIYMSYMTWLTTWTQLGEKHTKAHSPTIPSVVAMVFSHILSFLQLHARHVYLENIKKNRLNEKWSINHPTKGNAQLNTSIYTPLRK